MRGPPARAASTGRPSWPPSVHRLRARGGRAGRTCALPAFTRGARRWRRRCRCTRSTGRPGSRWSAASTTSRRSTGVFEAVFARRGARGRPARPSDRATELPESTDGRRSPRCRAPVGRRRAPATLPWHTLPRTSTATTDDDPARAAGAAAERGRPDRRHPARRARRGGAGGARPLAGAARRTRWPTRRSRRHAGAAGRAPDRAAGDDRGLPAYRLGAAASCSRLRRRAPRPLPVTLLATSASRCRATPPPTCT